MKRSIGFILVALLALTITASAQADALVWYTLAAGDGAVVSQGSGAPLVIEKANAPGTYNFTINVMADLTATPLNGWSLDLQTPSANVVANSFTNTGGLFDQNDVAGLGSGPGIIVDNAGAFQLFSGPVGGMVQLGSFNITITKPGNLNPVQIFSGIGGGGWSDAGFGPAPLNIAGDLISGGAIGSLTANPSIIIQNIPEPATIALLGLGLVGLVRRRR